MIQYLSFFLSFMVKFFFFFSFFETSCGVMANLLDCNILGSEFELKSRYYIHFLTHTH